MDILDKVIKKKPYDDISLEYVKNLIKKYPNYDYKQIRSLLRRNFSMFRNKKGHLSSFERTKIYSWLNSLIQTLPHEKIIDLGCGDNALYLFPELSCKEYFGYDLSISEKNNVDKYLISCKIKGQINLVDIFNYDTFPESDLVLALKIFDLVDDRDKVKFLLSKIFSKCFIVSFSTITLGKKLMNSPQRKWFEKMVNSLGYNYKFFMKEGEIFYLIKR